MDSLKSNAHLPVTVFSSYPGHITIRNLESYHFDGSVNSVICHINGMGKEAQVFQW